MWYKLNMKIYTKQGDKGQTGVIGRRLQKYTNAIESVGNLDELNASIGIIISALSNQQKIVDDLENIQKNLFSTGGILANGRVEVDYKKETKKLENSIDKMDKTLNPLQNFILPGGSIAGSYTHLSRTICRRTERSLVNLVENSIIDIDKIQTFDAILSYMNRLSDYFFTLARYINMLEGKSETIWNSRK